MRTMVSSARLRTTLPVVIVLLASLAAYANAVSGEFVFDDLGLVKENEAIRDLGNISRAFHENLWGSLAKASNYYRPLPLVLFMLIYAAFGPEPWPFHLLNVILHAGASVLVYLIVRRLLLLPSGSVATADTDPSSTDSSETAVAGTVPSGAPVGENRATMAALLAALWFALHPIHVEAVAWIVGVMDVSSACLTFLSFWAFLRAFGDGRGGRAVAPLPYALSLVSFFLATLCKEPAVLLPVLIFVCDYSCIDRGTRSLRRSLGRSVGHLLVLCVYLGLRIPALRGLAPVFAEPSDISGLLAWANVFPTFALYLWKLVLPLDLNVLHHIPPAQTLLSPRILAGVVAAVAFAAAGVWSWRRQSYVFMALAFILVPLAPALYLPGLGQQIENVFAERYVYQASAGAAMLLGLLVVWAKGRDRRLDMLVTASLVGCCIVFAVLTVTRNQVWHDNYRLWSDSVMKSPQSSPAHANLGYALLYVGRTEEGKRELKTARDLDPDMVPRMLRRGIALSRAGLLKQAILEFVSAVTVAPELPEAHYNLAVAYETRGWRELAVAHYRRAIDINPGFADARINLGVILAETGELAAAIEQFGAAVALAPNDPVTHANLARAYDAVGRQSEAAEERAIARRLADRQAGTGAPR